jgi:hypothetical protein
VSATAEAHPVIASMRDERDAVELTVEVPTLDVHVVEDGDVMDARHLRTEHTHCWCQDGRHRNEDHSDLGRYPSAYPPVGAHLIVAHIYAVITEAPE